jgi:uncharacterized protein Yka (UPF0111/DUF47 family)
MSARRWFLPQTPDVLAMLRAQAAATVEGIEALDAWARGEAGAADRVRELEHAADQRKRELRVALTEAFTTPLEPEDLFELSRGLDEILNSAKNAVREAEVMRAAPDPAMAAMTEELLTGTRWLADALGALGGRSTAAATDAADAAVKSQHRVERAYRRAMSALVDRRDLHEVAARRELYRRLARTSDRLVDVAERVWYSVLKES